MAKLNHYVVRGTVSNPAGRPLQGLIVRAFDKDLSGENALGPQAVTDAGGFYQLTYTDKDFRMSSEEAGGADIIIRVYDEDELIVETLPKRNAGAGETINITAPIERPRNQYVLKGTVRDKAGHPVSGAQVQACRRSLRQEALLGEGQTGEQGAFDISYFVAGADRDNINISLKVISREGKLLHQTQVRYNVPKKAEIDIQLPFVYPGHSEFERMVRSIQPHLVNGLTFADLEQDGPNDDIIFLAGETGFDADRVVRLGLAHRLGSDSKIAPEFWYALLGFGFYKISVNTSLQEQFKSVRAALPSMDGAAARKALNTAFSEHIIPPNDKQATGWINNFLEYAADQAIGAGVAGTTTFVKQVLEEAGITERGRRLKFSRKFNQFRVFSPELTGELKQDESFQASEIADIETSFRLAELINSDFSAVKVIKKEFDIRRPEAIRSLAQKTTQEWIDLVEKNVKSGGLKLPFNTSFPAGLQQQAGLYGKQLAVRFRDAFPTAAFTGGLKRALQNEHMPALKHAEKLSRFLDAYPEFEFLNTSIDTYFQSKGRPDLNVYQKDNDFRQEMKAVQRVFKLAASYEAIDTLLADNLHSAQKIYRMGESEFVRKYKDRPGFDEKSARKTWHRAADTHAAVLTLVAELKDLEHAGDISALRVGSDDVSGFPNWNNLFRSGDNCECEQCRSVLSPAAYFADLLMFLKDRKAKNPAFSVKDILLTRRPDLGYIELNCQNANTTLPYIDVVCEVLEDLVAAGENDLELTGLTAINADPAQAKTDVQNVFQVKGIPLGAGFTLSQIGGAERWVLHDDRATYLLKKKGSPGYFAEILRNTKAGAAELRANPQYVNLRAYQKLKGAKHPFALPFDLFNEEVRAAFHKAGLKRWELMEVFRGTAAPNNPAEGDMAAEYFGISVDTGAALDEKRIILQADPGHQHEYWGEQDNPSMVASLTNVQIFLNKTGLAYNELLALLDLKFINPDQNMQIIHLDCTCDTESKEIRTLDKNKLDRIHRFLRLWRKLKDWQMWELDLVIRHPGIGRGILDETFLIRLMHLTKLKNRLGQAGVEQLCSLLGNLNTETRFTALHEEREDALYQNLFLNKKLIHPLDTAFEVAKADISHSAATISAHMSVVIAALRVKESELTIYKSLTKTSDGTSYISDELTLGNLSFLYRHSWLAKQLKCGAEEWQTLLKLLNRDIDRFAEPREVTEFINIVEALRQTGFSTDELNYLLCADRQAKAAVKEQDAARFLLALRSELQTVAAAYDAVKYPFLQVSPPTDVEQLTALLTILLQKLNRTEQDINGVMAVFQDTVTTSVPVQGLPAGFDFPAEIKDTIRIRYDGTDKTLRFAGLMLPAEQTLLKTDPSLAAVSGIQAYRDAVDELFRRPRLALKFYEPVFTAPLKNLTAAVNFKEQLPAGLSAKISFDTEQRLLCFSGIMTQGEKTALEGLSANAGYLNALCNLFTRPRDGAFTPDELWLEDAELSFPLRDKLPENLAAACQKATAYLKRTQSEKTLTQLLSAQLGLTPAMIGKLITHYKLLPPDPILKHFTGSFAASGGAVDYSGCKDTFDTYFWLFRAALILNKWQVELKELEWLINCQTSTRTLDLKSLPLEHSKPPLETFIRTSRLFLFRDGLDESQITLLDILEKIIQNAYPADLDFAGDVCLLKTWKAEDVSKITRALDLVYPGDYLLAENWERLSSAAGFLEKLNAGSDAVIPFANPTVGETESKTIKQLLRSRYGDESWLELSTEIQDVLRERKRDALVAWLLTRPQPVDAPTGKWENTNDVYACYLLDVEMSSGMLTSRLVQASGSVQLFVQRCMMGLEPDVTVKADGGDGDGAWRWWKWMRKYRVWEANRKVFLYPENWLEPELRQDKSTFFKDLENELLQNEVNQYTVETAFLNYLEKLDGVAHLEIAGFYQEDDASRTIIHAFGRSKGAEPHIYYYRQYDYRSWTPWEKVDLDIAGDYLIPAVVNKRLFLFWPVFTEIPDEAGNKTVPTPTADSTATMPETRKRLRLQIAVSECRNGKWTPKKVSKDVHQSVTYAGEISQKHYKFWPVDRSEIDGRFGIKYEGYSIGTDGFNKAALYGAFEIFGCKGVPEQVDNFPGSFQHYILPDQVESSPVFMKYAELRLRTDYPENDFSLIGSPSFITEGFAHMIAGSLTPVLVQTPHLFKIAMAWHPSFPDRLLLDIPQQFKELMEGGIPAGTWLPFFYADKLRTYFVLPMFSNGDNGRYYPEIKQSLQSTKDILEGYIRQAMQSVNPDNLPPEERQLTENYLADIFNVTPPLSKEQIAELTIRLYLQTVNLYLASISMFCFNFRRFHFNNYYHPFACDFARLVYNPLLGIPALMSRQTQLKNTGFSFQKTYQPTQWVVEEFAGEDYYPNEVVDFSPGGGYSSYNWELFFHAPLMIASRLSKNQRFEEAMQWFHYIFNPVGVEGTLPDGTPAGTLQKYWITKPFFLTTDEEYKKQRIDSILRMLAGDDKVAEYTTALKKELEDQVTDWRDNPFEPHRIARYRTAAYQKTTIMKYIDNLIDWGDYLFRQDTMESINEATQLYILAAEILGPRPKKVPPQAKPAVETYSELEEQLDCFSNALVQVENLIPVMPGSGQDKGDAAPLPMLCFCIPQNEQLLGYWDTVADRLYKIRHCMNIEGVLRQLSLFEPPIDPGALVKAVAGGMDIASVLADLNAPLPYYRFNILLQKASEFCGDVKVLGNALLSALEKKDAEALGLLRQNQETRLLEAMKDVKEKLIIEAKENLEALRRSKAVVEVRRNYFRDIERITSKEQLHLDKLSEANTLQNIAQGIKLGASIVSIMPAIDLGASGFGGSPVAKFKIGGLELGQAAGLAAEVLGFLSGIAANEASMASSQAASERRWDDWKLQERLAGKELEQIDKQISSAELRLTIAEKELANHLIQIENAKATYDFLKTKYTNQELYQWLAGEISRVYFQSYQLAYDMAKRADRCYHFELGTSDSNYIQFGYWDSLKKGLLAGEKLQYDLRRLDAAYLEQNRREFELTKHISLTLLNPLALVQLKETGRCFFSLPEEIFDLDYPGHYFRRIKSVSITLPCVAGPYTTISCTLRLLKNHIRTKTTIADGYGHKNDDGVWTDDERFVENNIPVKAIAASSAQHDSGVFELSFRDERYLPFEGAGVISDWSLELFHDLPANNPDPANPDFGRLLRQFDYGSISDAVIHIRYTAREDAGLFKNAALTNLREYYTKDNSTPGVRMFSLRHEFPGEWHRFLNPSDTDGGNILDLALTKNHFPFKDSSHALKVNTLALFARCRDTGNYEAVFSPPLPAPPPDKSDTMIMACSQTFGNLHFAARDTSGDSIMLDFGTDIKWRLKVKSPAGKNLQPDEIEELIVILGYEWKQPN